MKKHPQKQLTLEKKIKISGTHLAAVMAQEAECRTGYLDWGIEVASGMVAAR